MANKMLIERVEDLEITLGKVAEFMLQVARFIEFVDTRIPVYDGLIENRKKVLKQAKKMRLAKKKKAAKKIQSVIEKNKEKRI